MNDTQGLEFARSYAPTKPIQSYAWVRTYAQEKMGFYERLTNVLDDKAQALMRYIGGAGIAVSTILPVVFRDHPAFLLPFLPALGALLMSVVRSGQCAEPQDYSQLPNIKKAFEYAEYFGDDAETRFYAVAVPAEETLQALVERKAWKIHCAFRYLWFGLLWLILAVAFGTFATLGVVATSPSLLFPVLWLVVGLAVVGVFVVLDRKKA